MPTYVALKMSLPISQINFFHSKNLLFATIASSGKIFVTIASYTAIWRKTVETERTRKCGWKGSAEPEHWTMRGAKVGMLYGKGQHLASSLRWFGASPV